MPSQLVLMYLRAHVLMLVAFQSRFFTERRGQRPTIHHSRIPAQFPESQECLATVKIEPGTSDNDLE